MIDLFEDFPRLEQNHTIHDPFEKLSKFKRQAINLELWSHGQYFRKEGVFATEVCNDEIEKYYDHDNTTIDLKNMDLLKYQYNLLTFFLCAYFNYETCLTKYNCKS